MSSKRARKTIPIAPVAPYLRGAKYLVIPAEAPARFPVCRSIVQGLESNGAWLVLEPESPGFPIQEEVFLVEFQGQFTVTHRTRILRREETRVWVDCPPLTQRNRSELSPDTGRQDFRVPADLSVVIILKGPEFAQSLPRSGQLNDLSRGGMGLVVPLDDIYSKGQKIEVQVVSWAYPVSVETTIERVWIDESNVKRLALKFPDDLTSDQRERVSAFILQVQRKESLQSLLPALIEEP